VSSPQQPPPSCYPRPIDLTTTSTFAPPAAALNLIDCLPQRCPTLAACQQEARITQRSCCLPHARLGPSCRPRRHVGLPVPHHLLCAFRCVAATTGHRSHVARTSCTVPLPLHAQVAAASPRLAFCSTHMRLMQCPLRAPAPAHARSSFCPRARLYRGAHVPFVHPTSTRCPPPVSHAAASPVLSSREPPLLALNTACFSSTASPGAPPTLGVAHRPSTGATVRHVLCRGSGHLR
jgi:hypothetical protein